MQQTHFSPGLRRLHCQVAQADPVISRTSEGEHPIHLEQPTMSHLPQQSNGLEPAETFLDPLPLPLADAVAFIPRCPLVDGTAAAPTIILRDMRCDLHMAALGNE